MRQTGSGAAGQSGDPASQAQRGAAGSATTRPHSTAGSLARGGTCRAKPAENPRDSVAPHRYMVENSLDAVLGCKYSGNNAATELHWGEIIVKYCISIRMETHWIGCTQPDCCPDTLLQLTTHTPGCPLAPTPHNATVVLPVCSDTAAMPEIVENPHGWLWCWVTMGL